MGKSKERVRRTLTARRQETLMRIINNPKASPIEKVRARRLLGI